MSQKNVKKKNSGTGCRFNKDCVFNHQKSEQDEKET